MAAAAATSAGASPAEVAIRARITVIIIAIIVAEAIARRDSAWPRKHRKQLAHAATMTARADDVIRRRRLIAHQQLELALAI